MENLWDKIQEAVAFIQSKGNVTPRVGIVLGSGLGALIDEISIEYSIEYKDIPHFPLSTVEGHSGKLVFGTIGSTPIVAMQGRFHLYEGYSAKQVAFPVQVMKFLGIERLFVSNAAGGINAKMEMGDLMIITDHINFQNENPLIGLNDDRLGPRFPDMSEAYDSKMIEQAEAIVQKEGIGYIKGVYLGLKGPNLETKAEYKAFNIMGADAVGMSTVPEVLVANHMGIPVFAMSVVTNVCYPPERVVETTHQDVIDVANVAEPKLTKVFSQMIQSL